MRLNRYLTKTYIINNFYLSLYNQDQLIRIIYQIDFK